MKHDSDNINRVTEAEYKYKFLLKKTLHKSRPNGRAMKCLL